MGLFKKKPSADQIKYEEIQSLKQVEQMYRLGKLVPLLLMPTMFGGEDVPANRIYVPAFVVELKDRYDHMVADLLTQDKVNGYNCSPTYKGKSFVASSLAIVAEKDQQPILTEIINIW